MELKVGSYKTRCGMLARVLTTEMPTDRPAVGYILGMDGKAIGGCTTWFSDGRFFESEESVCDLVEEVTE